MLRDLKRNCEGNPLDLLWYLDVFVQLSCACGVEWGGAGGASGDFLRGPHPNLPHSTQRTAQSTLHKTSSKQHIAYCPENERQR